MVVSDGMTKIGDAPKPSPRMSASADASLRLANEGGSAVSALIEAGNIDAASDVWLAYGAHRTPERPEHLLMAAVLSTAILDCLWPPGGSKDGRAASLRRDAIEWLNEPPSAYPYCFRGICDYLGLCADTIMVEMNRRTLPLIGSKTESSVKYSGGRLRYIKRTRCAWD